MGRSRPQKRPLPSGWTCFMTSQNNLELLWFSLYGKKTTHAKFPRKHNKANRLSHCRGEIFRAGTYARTHSLAEKYDSSDQIGFIQATLQTSADAFCNHWTRQCLFVHLCNGGFMHNNSTTIITDVTSYWNTSSQVVFCDLSSCIRAPVIQCQ